MGTSYYPWNVQVLASWLRLELTNHPSPRALANVLQIPSHSLRAWLSHGTPSITLAEIRAIAHYRRWTMQQTIAWLALKPAHVEELLAQDQLSNWAGLRGSESAASPTRIFPER